MLRKASTKTPTKTFQFSENFQVVVFLATIKHYLLQVFEERNVMASEAEAGNPECNAASKSQGLSTSIAKLFNVRASPISVIKISGTFSAVKISAKAS